MRSRGTQAVFGLMLGLTLILAGGSRPVAAAAENSFPFHDGDRVVFLGDSITEQRLYTTYLETYLLTRFPGWKLSFRNAGWGGDTSWLRQRGLPLREALVRDVISLKPTVVTIDFGMNDAGYGAFREDLYQQHINGLRDIVTQLKAAGVRPIVLTASAVEKREPGNDLEGYNQNLERFAEGDRQLAATEHVPFADQLHPFIAAINRLRSAQPDARLSSDVVHPGPAGHLMMADFILTGLNAPPIVSSVALDGISGRVIDKTGAEVSNVHVSGDTLTFQRKDSAIVFPIENSARPVLQIVPVTTDLDRYLLRVTRLRQRAYTVSVNGTDVATFSAAQLQNGVNLSFYDSPLMAQGREILRHVYQKNNIYFDLWRKVELGNAPDRMAQESTLLAQIEVEERLINSLRTPQTFQITVSPAYSAASPRREPTSRQVTLLRQSGTSRTWRARATRPGKAEAAGKYR